MLMNTKWLTVIVVGIALIVGGLLMQGCSGGGLSAEGCSDCHDDSTLIQSRQVQWENSLHGAGYTFERNSAACGTCHTSEGFATRLEVGSWDVGEDVIDNPTPVNCRTCHEIHTSYTEDDWALTVNGPITLEYSGETVDFGSGGNLCASCHQPRSTEFGIPEAGGGDYEITSTRFGPHHGPQSTVLTGLAGFNVGTTSAVHATEDGCVMCHMSDAYGKQAGGHTMNTAYEYHDEMIESTASCEACHSDIEDFDYEGVRAEVEVMMEELNGLLVAQGLLTNTGSSVPGVYTSEQAGALWNYKTILEDRSNGIHNAKFTKALLQAALDALG